VTDKHQQPTACPNCGQTLETGDKFCRQCGQPNHDLRVPFRHLILELLEGIFHFDSKSFRTIVLLLFKPGRLTNEFMAGRRVSYVPPIRMYIFLSFIFFVILSLTSAKRHDTAGVENAIEFQDSSATADFKSNELQLSLFGINSKNFKNLDNTQIDSALDAQEIDKTTFNRYMARQLGRIEHEGRAEYNHKLVSMISYMAFVLMPIFALFMYLLYRKQTEYYIDCLVFSVHFHSFIYLLFSLILIIHLFLDWDILYLTMPIFLGVYCYWGLRKVYRQSRLLTILKTTLIGILHTFSVIMALFLAAMISIILF
jgi:hypothetical protein